MTSDTFEQAKAEALAGFMDAGPGHYNCAQAVMHVGLRLMDQDPALRSIGSFMGGGMARMGQVCGALSGAAIVLGLREQLELPGRPDKSATLAALQQLMSDFEAQFGAVTCKDLLACDISTAENYNEAKRSQATKRCPDFVAWSSDRMAEMLGDGSSGA